MAIKPVDSPLGQVVLNCRTLIECPVVGAAVNRAVYVVFLRHPESGAEGVLDSRNGFISRKGELAPLSTRAKRKFKYACNP